VTTSPDHDATGAGRDPGSENPGIDAGQAADVLRTLANSIALLPQAPAPDEAPEGALTLPIIEHEGQRYIPVFTSEESLRSAGADPGTAVSIPIVDLAAHWPSDDLWLAVDPASQDGLGLPPDVVRALPALAGRAG
jgi:SseB protein N-terminal domain